MTVLIEVVSNKYTGPVTVSVTDLKNAALRNSDWRFHRENELLVYVEAENDRVKAQEGQV